MVGASSKSIVSGHPNSGIPSSEESNAFTRKITEDTISVEYLFPPKFEQQIVRSTLEIPKRKYVTETENEDMYHNQINNAVKDPFVSQDIADTFIPTYPVEEVRKITNFVQFIEYKRDAKSTDSMNYSRHPVETLVDNVGDCKDKSILLYSLLKQRGYTVGYVIYPQHIAPIIARSEVEDSIPENIESVVQDDTDDYIVLESTHTMPLGKSEYNAENIIYSYTEKNGFTTHNIQAITKQIKRMVEV